MEENVAKLTEEQIPQVDRLKGELFQKTLKQEDWDDETTLKRPRDLAEEEESLRTYLDKLKKENFTLRTRVKAWQTTLETKMDELKKADLKLEELYNEIWSEREKFCSRLEKFNEEYGILSNWWEMQVRFVTELESTGGKALEDEKEIENLEKEIQELRKKIEELQARKRETEEPRQEEGIRKKNPSTTEGDAISRKESKAHQAKQVGKKVKFSEVVEEYSTGKMGVPKNDLYAVVDLEKVKNAKRRRKNNFSSRDKNILQTLRN